MFIHSFVGSTIFFQNNFLLIILLGFDHLIVTTQTFLFRYCFFVRKKYTFPITLKSSLSNKARDGMLSSKTAPYESFPSSATFFANAFNTSEP